MEKVCSGCYFYDLCPGENICENYSPIDDDEYIDALEKSEKKSFYKDWDKYIEEFQNNYAD